MSTWISTPHSFEQHRSQSQHQHSSDADLLDAYSQSVVKAVRHPQALNQP